jgi:hypothetical protein
MNAIHEIKFGPRFTALIGVAAALAVGLCFVLLGGTALGYAIVGTVIAMAILSGIFGVIV